MHPYPAPPEIAVFVDIFFSLSIHSKARGAIHIPRLCSQITWPQLTPEDYPQTCRRMLAQIYYQKAFYNQSQRELCLCEGLSLPLLIIIRRSSTLSYSSHRLSARIGKTWSLWWWWLASELFCIKTSVLLQHLYASIRGLIIVQLLVKCFLLLLLHFINQGPEESLK